jgi:hypothetical protein
MSGVGSESVAVSMEALRPPAKAFEATTATTAKR